MEKSNKKMSSERLPEILDKLSGNNPFRTPDSYFESLPVQILSRINSVPGYEEKAPALPFTVPDGYFEKLPAEVSGLISSDKKQVSQAWIPLLRTQLALTVAALIILIAFSIRWYQGSVTLNVPEKLTAEDLRSSGIITDIDEGMIIDVLASTTTEMNNSYKENIRQYLLDNNVDVYQIESEL
ncbi:MAG: hypothetical protein IT242_04405 [Bacteroidia bacterium]|nr:hypothetical protein [Bacteroidia bacterium]